MAALKVDKLRSSEVLCPRVLVLIKGALLEVEVDGELPLFSFLGHCCVGWGLENGQLIFVF